MKLSDAAELRPVAPTALGRAPTPTERVIAQRADPEELTHYQSWATNQPLTFRSWDAKQETDMLTWYVGPELSRTPQLLRQIVTCNSRYVGLMGCILDIKPGEPVPGLGEGYCELGTILSSEEFYDYGCDIAALHAAGVELTWEAAQWLHAAGRAQLVERHRKDEVYGDLNPRKIRLNLFCHPTPQQPAGYVCEDQEPPVFVFESHSHDADAATDLADFARAIALITRHPDAKIDALLRDPQSAAVLRDLLLERGGPVEMMLGDAAEAELAWLPLPETEHIDGELADLWGTVLRLDPMIDTSKPEIFDLPGPWIVSMHGPKQ